MKLENKTKNFSQEDFADQFADYYSETTEIYGENIEEAYNDFLELSQDEYGLKDIAKKIGTGIKNTVGEGGKLDKWIDRTGNKLRRNNLNSPYGSQRAFSAEEDTEVDQYTEEEYGFGADVGNIATKAASTIGSGLTKTGGAMKKTLASTTRSAVTGAALGAGVNSMRGKSMVKGAIGGAALGGAASLTSKSFSIKDNKINMNNEKQYSEEALFADQFASYYVETEDIYGDDIEAAYTDFLEFANGEVAEEMYSEEDTYSEEEIAEAFADFYANSEDIYGEDMEEAYADFISLMNEETEEETYSDEELTFEDFYAETYDLYGENVEEAYSDFIGFTGEEVEDEYGLKDIAKKIGTGIKNTVGEGGKLDKWIDRTGNKLRRNNLNSPYGSQRAFSAEDEVESDMDVFSDGFAQFYAENEEAYGDSDEGLEEAYDDYADNIADESLEAQYSAYESEYASYLKTTGKGALIGAGLGLAGGLIASNVGADAKERKALKLKARNGNLTESEKARYSELKMARRNRIAKNAVGGSALGALTGSAAHISGADKGIKSAYHNFKGNKNLKLTDRFKEASVIGKEVAANTRLDRKYSDASTESKEKQFSAIDLIGRAGNNTVTALDKTFSGFTGKTEGKDGSRSMVLNILGK